ncbi:unnamed protein product [Microthlaspi erraticum]|uniref:Uncharacterized protein n=1 Tax=Microthlaspi erraticum TaxID=1685480 RepID=A0A6D2ILG4_9BRAS|nr:unnamed protein product [Microthlaspi erraticum]CAA7058533.1 unnamed protein product [Microthlaspi erraticum]
MVLKGYMLYIFTTLRYIRLLDLSGQYGYKESDKLPSLYHLSLPSFRIKAMMDGQAARESYNIAVTPSGQILLVVSILFKSTGDRILRLFKSNHPVDTQIFEVYTL